MKYLVAILLSISLHGAMAQQALLPPIVHYLDSAFERLPSAAGAWYRRETEYRPDSMAGIMRTYYLSGQLQERIDFKDLRDHDYNSAGSSYTKEGQLIRHFEHNRRYSLDLRYYPTGQLKRREYEGSGLFRRQKKECFGPDGSLIPYFAYETRPRYPEGDGEPKTVIDIIRRSLHYPEDALREHIEGRVFVACTIAASGEVENVRVVRSLMPSMDAEAIRAVQHLKRFEPAQTDGIPRKVNYIFPIDFIIK